LRHEPPLLVAEISSRSSRDIEFGKKRRTYATGSAEWYWILDLLRHEVVIFKNVNASLDEVQRITTPSPAAGHFPILVDPHGIPAG